MLFLHKTFPLLVAEKVSPKAPTPNTVEPYTAGSLAKSPNEADAEPILEFSRFISHSSFPFTALSATKEPPLNGKSTLFPKAVGDTVAKTFVFF